MELSSHDFHPRQDRKRDILPSRGKRDSLFGMSPQLEKMGGKILSLVSILETSKTRDQVLILNCLKGGLMKQRSPMRLNVSLFGMGLRSDLSACHVLVCIYF